MILTDSDLIYGYTRVKRVAVRVENRRTLFIYIYIGRDLSVLYERIRRNMVF